MVMTGGWFMALFYPHYYVLLCLISSVKSRALSRLWTSHRMFLDGQRRLWFWRRHSRAGVGKQDFNQETKSSKNSAVLALSDPIWQSNILIISDPSSLKMKTTLRMVLLNLGLKVDGFKIIPSISLIDFNHPSHFRKSQKSQPGAQHHFSCDGVDTSAVNFDVLEVHQGKVSTANICLRHADVHKIFLR